ncbi:MAG: transposase [Eubacteriales bacterium]|nr:transposase [Eubacteriales bacterium]
MPVSIQQQVRISCSKQVRFSATISKDTFYRFDLNEKANWERLQLETARNVILDIESRTDEKHINCLIFDDSLYRRTGGKGTDLCAKVFDHNDNKMRVGFRMMTGGWSNGEIYIPFQQSLMTTRKSHLMIGKDEHVDGRTLRGKRRTRAKEKGTAVVQSMVQEAQKAGIPFDYVLFDTWFSNPAQLAALKSIGADVIAMIKKNSTKYTLPDPSDDQVKSLNVKEIYSRFRKRPGNSKYLLCVNVKVSDRNGDSIPAKLVYARNRNNKKQWVCFVCTDMRRSPEDILRIYTARWACEVYFSVAKSCLKLRTECHSTSYDAITAHMVFVAIRYMILAVIRFENTDNRGIEEIMYGIQREIINEMMNCAIILIIDTLLDSVRECFGATESQIKELVNVFISKLPEVWRCRFTAPQAG